MMRLASKVIEWPVIIFQKILANGFMLPEAFGPELSIPATPWFTLLGLAALLAHWAGGWSLAALITVTGAYLLLFGLWKSAMMTLAFVISAVGVAAVLGIGLGIAAWRSPAIERIFVPFYDLLQVLPIFSYLLPIVVFFGFGPLAGLVATVIFAMPPMARVTTIALRKLPASIHEVARMAGCNRSQTMLLVLLPAARTDLLVGLNQVVNLSFAVAVFAAIIGAGGLGNDLFAALKSLRLGPAIEAGIAITLLAIVLDRTARSLSMRRVVHADPTRRFSLSTHPHRTLAAALILISLAIMAFAPELAQFPKAYTLSTGRWTNELVSVINRTAGDTVGTVRDALIIGLLRPIKDTLLAVPWSLFVAIASIAAYYIAGLRLAVTVAALLLSIVIMGYWAPAMTSLYLALLGTVLACFIGFPIGLAGALSPRIGSVNDVLVDLIQTLPPFVYLVPVMLVLGIGDVPALAAIAIYAIAPPVRFTQSGLTQIKGSVIEAAIMSGCTKTQALRLVRLPLARRSILLGLNQAIIMAFGMLVITAMVGTRGLEANTLLALGKIDTGEGLLAGLALVALTIACERLVSAAAESGSARVHP
ncbi:MAG: ABC transporter permease subunit [Hyphomicrobiales bacterium]